MAKRSGRFNIAGLPEAIFPHDDQIGESSTEGSKIVDFFNGKCVLVTGATGFLGKLLVEKLLRACTGIEKIFVLIRAKKGDDPGSRARKLYDDLVFHTLCRSQPDFRKKIQVIQGDSSIPGLGLSQENREILIEKVNVVLHAAATVRFDEPLKTAISVNVRGTRDLIELCKRFKNLESFVYIGTAYAYCLNKEVDEILYDAPISTQEIIDIVEKNTNDNLNLLQPNLLKGWPNTYAYSKSIAENTVRDYVNGFPACIFRPAVIVATYQEPVRSWIDNYYGATGVVIGAGTGLLRTLHCDEKLVAELVPADFVVNAIIAAAYKTAIDNKQDIAVYNYVSGNDNPITWETFMDLNEKYGKQVPTIRAVWYYSLTLNKNKYVDLFYMVLFHFIPAIFIDFGLIIIGRPPMMWKVYKKIYKFTSTIEYFSMRQWLFSNKKLHALWKSLSKEDRSNFNFDMKSLDWDDYHQTHVMGLRTYVVKDDPSTLPQAKIKWNRFLWMHRGFKLILYLVIVWILFGILSPILHCIF